MGSCARVGLIAGLLFFGFPRPVLAGMPTPVPSDWAVQRMSAISFFGVVLLLCAGIIYALWNRLAADFPQLPTLTYKKALLGTVLWGFGLTLVLTMIAGARELLTPRAWEKQGLLYKVADSEAPKPTVDTTAQRREQLQQLKEALLLYAARHEGKFPASENEESIAKTLWEVPGSCGTKYLYVPALSVDPPSRILVYEPAVHGEDRFVLYTDGQIATLKSSEIRQALQGEQP